MRLKVVLMFALVLLSSSWWLFAQDDDPLINDPDCDPAILGQQIFAFQQALRVDFTADPVQARDNLFRLGALYQDAALRCGYQPSETEIQAQIQRTLGITDVASIVQASAIGADVQLALYEIASLSGDPLRGESLYNGAIISLDGGNLACSGCHSEGVIAPMTEGTWTRIAEGYLLESQFAGYSVERYLVESILQPNSYIAPGYAANVMPQNYGNRMDAQELADLVAYLMSQDQLLDP